MTKKYVFFQNDAPLRYSKSTISVRLMKIRGIFFQIQFFENFGTLNEFYKLKKLNGGSEIFTTPLWGLFTTFKNTKIRFTPTRDLRCASRWFRIFSLIVALYGSQKSVFLLNYRFGFCYFSSLLQGYFPLKIDQGGWNIRHRLESVLIYIIRINPL